jgi:hypothetical protein
MSQVKWKELMGGAFCQSVSLHTKVSRDENLPQADVHPFGIFFFFYLSFATQPVYPEKLDIGKKSKK